jgi:hypothetical protein
MATSRGTTRRRLLGCGLIGAGLVGACATQAWAGPKTPKAQVKYQFTPNGAERCGLCDSFIAPSGGGDGPGGCKVVEGPIPQTGWCVLYSPMT